MEIIHNQGTSARDAGVPDENNDETNVQLETVVEELEGDLEDKQSIESLVESIENNMEQDMNEFNQINEEVDNSIQNLENNLDTDLTPIKRNRRQQDKSYAQIKGVQEDEGIVDEITFAQVLYRVFQQMSLNAGIKKFGDRAVAGMTKDLRQLHLMIVLYQENKVN